MLLREEGERSRRESPGRSEKEGRVERAERKLKVANAKIVELLREKAQMKQQLQAQ